MPTETATPAPESPTNPPWQAAGFHWHIYRQPAAGPALPGAGDRKDRLTTLPEATRGTPHAVAGWLAREAERYDGCVFLWIAEEDCWRRLGDLDTEFERVRVELMLLAAFGESVYVMACDGTERHDLFAEAVTAAECDDHSHCPDTVIGQTRSES